MPEHVPSEPDESLRDPPPPPEGPADVPTRRDGTEVDSQQPDRVQLEPRVWSILAHLSLFVLPVLGPLLILGLQGVLLGRRSELVTHHCKQATLWHVSLIIVGIATVGIGAVIMAVFTLYAALKAGQGEDYAFPLIGDYASRAL